MTLRRPAAGVCITMLVGMAALAPAANEPIFVTGFESLNDPSGIGYALASLNNQGGWKVNEGGAAFVVAGPETTGAGTRFLKIAATSTVSRSAASDATHAIAKLKLRTNGTDELSAPAAVDGIAVLLGIRQAPSNQLVVAGFDGGLQQFVEPSGGAPFDAAAWNDYTVAINYTAKTYTVAVNGTVLLDAVPFRNNTATALRNFAVSTQNGSSLDEVGLYSSNGDYDNDGLSDVQDMAIGTNPLLTDTDGDGFSDGYEHTNGTNPLDGDRNAVGAVPVLGDVNEDGAINAADVTELANRISAAHTFSLPEKARADIDGNNTVDMQDVLTIVEYAVGNSGVLR